MEEDICVFNDVIGAKFTRESLPLMGIIMNNPQFRRELAAPKTETRSALGLQSSNSR